MTSTSNTSFHGKTTAFEVAQSYPQAIHNRTILVTGVNKAGLGYAISEAFASQYPHTLILAGRSEYKLKECVESIRSQYPDIPIIRPLLVDLGSMKSVRRAGDEVMAWNDVPLIHIVVNNAGIMRHGDSHEGEIPKSEDGLEDMFATNFLGHFVLTNKIMPKIIAAAKQSHESNRASVRIINLSSSGVWISPFRPSDLNWETSSAKLPENERPNYGLMKHAGMKVDEDSAYNPTAAYCHSKTCKVLFSVGLNQRLYDKYSILSLAVNPGEIRTELQRHTPPDWLARAMQRRRDMGIHDTKTPGQGASTVLVAACDPKLSLPGEDGSGCFLGDCQIAKMPPYSVDQEAAQKLWQTGEKLAEEDFSP